jgi:hypothetical protein
MYRACSTWQYEVAAHLVEEHRGGLRLGYLASGEYTNLLRKDHEKAKQSPGTTRDWRVIKAHEGERSMAHELAAGTARALYAYRDVRDVVFSLMHKRGKTFEQILRQGMIHQILANDRFWMAQPDVLVQRYEDLLAHPSAGVEELASHLGLALDEADAERIADQYSQESNRARTEALRQRLEEAGVDLQNAGNTQICDPSSLLHWNHMRQKGAASWQTSATPRQRAILHRLCGRWLKARGYSLDGNPPRRVDLSVRGVRERLQGEVDLMIGLLNFLVRTTSLRFPKTARFVKRILGMPVETNAGATVWADPIPARSAPDAPREAA